MKNLIYLDTSFLHSFIAQIESGLPISSSTEIQESETHSSVKGTSGELANEIQIEGSTGKLNLHVISLPTAKAVYKIGHKKGNSQNISLTQLEAGKEIISRQLHDNALNVFESYLNDNQLLSTIENDDDVDEGSYIKLTSTFSIVDIEYFVQLFNEEFKSIAFDFNIESSKISEFEELERSNDTENIKKGKRRSLETKYKKIQDDSDRTYNFIINILKYLVKILPTKSYIKLGRFVAPMKSEFLRETSKELMFKYGTSNQVINITLIGKATRRFENLFDAIPNPEGLFNVVGTVSQAMDTFVSQINLLDQNDYIIEPVAIYFE